MGSSNIQPGAIGAPHGALATTAAAGLMSVTQATSLSVVPVGNFVASYLYSQVIDMTVIGTYTLIPPTAQRVWLISTPFFEIKTVNTCTVSPTFQFGTNSTAFNNLGASQTVAAFTTQAAETRTNATVVSPVPLLDLTASGLMLNVTVGATATALTVRMYLSFGLLPE